MFFSKLLSPLDTDYCCSGTWLNSVHSYHSESSCTSMLVWVTRRSGFSYCWCTDCGSRQWFRNWAAWVTTTQGLTSSGFMCWKNWSHTVTVRRAVTWNDWSCWQGNSGIKCQIFWWRGTVVWICCNVDGQEYHFRTVTWLDRNTQTDVVVSQFNVVRRLQPWTNVITLQQRALACPPSLVELRKMYQIMIALPVTSAECERNSAN